MAKVESKLAEIVKPVPSRPRKTRVEIDPLQRRITASRR
jgi:hypothetical protein